MFDFLQYVIDIFIVVALPPAQDSCQVISCSQWKNSHLWRILRESQRVKESARECVREKKRETEDLLLADTCSER